MQTERKSEFKEGQKLVVNNAYPFLMRDKNTEPTGFVSAQRLSFLDIAVSQKGLPLAVAEIIANRCCQEYWDYVGFEIHEGMIGKFTGLTTTPVHEDEKSCLLIEFEHRGDKVYAIVGDQSVSPF